MMKDIYSTSLLDLLPQSLTSDPFVKAVAAAIDPELQSVATEIVLCLLLSRIDELPEDVVDHLAWQLHVDFYESGLPLATKRALVKNSVDWHQRKGTPYVVQEMVSTVLADGKVYEWFEYGGDPYKFRVETTDYMQSDIAYERLATMVNAVKNLRSWLEGIIVRRNADMSLGYGIGILTGVHTGIYPPAPDLGDAQQPIHIGGIHRAGRYVTMQTAAYLPDDLTQRQNVGMGYRASRYDAIRTRFILGSMNQSVNAGSFYRMSKYTEIKEVS